ncbi:hypothetical protein IAR55_001843 [Kwoniella newhampshirensis]|uniref:Major facilitator superfamily (MFS) profile domain-containing protein n=1 Tax=Kwoniella newhampshirensis TaxID=1651941 RepID=A0AAW0Z381_9TREE
MSQHQPQTPVPNTDNISVGESLDKSSGRQQNSNSVRTVRQHQPQQTSTQTQAATDRPILERQTSRLSTILTHVRSNEVYPPPEWDDSNADVEEEDELGRRSVEGITRFRTTTAITNEDAELGGLGEKEVGKQVETVIVDIEHTPVKDDPRKWNDKKKWFVLIMMTFALLGPTMASSIYNPVINQVQGELHGTATEIGLSLSMYILLQGATPVLWAALSEINGRKTSYLLSYALYVVANVVASRANSMPLLIVMRILQATGSGAVNSAGAGSLADMYEMHERGEKLGIYYSVPMFGPGIGPIVGGALGQAFGWRSVFYFSAAFGGIMEILFIFFPDSWRKERSRTYQKAAAKAAKRAEQRLEKARVSVLEKQGKSRPINLGQDIEVHPTSEAETISRRVGTISEQANVDVEAGRHAAGTVEVKRKWYLPFGNKVVEAKAEYQYTVSLGDLNPFPLMTSVMRRPANLLAILSSGICFSAQYTIVYTASITLGDAPYSYNSLKIGLVILSFGVGNICASVIGGRYSDVVLRRTKKRNGGVGVPEMRLKATFIAMPFIVASFLTYAWCAEEKVHIAGIVVSLFFAGASLMWMYSPTLAYLVDSNPGLSAPSSSCASLMRGCLACIMSQIAVPIRNGIGDGGLYTLFAGLLAVGCGIVILLSFKGEQWRIRANAKRENRAKKEEAGS